MTDLGPKRTPHRLLINNHTYEALIEPSDTLLHVLREDLDFIGTKQGCDKGDCGACTVLVDGKPILSCISIAKTFNETEAITTIEGVDNDILTHAFLKSGALQCGFCQPGMILSAKALLLKNSNPSIHEIKSALSGNLCRCTGYTKIYLAIMCASLVVTNKAHDLDEALAMMRAHPIHLGDQ